MKASLKNFIKKHRKEIKKVQSFEGERYSKELKKNVAKLVKKGVSRYQISKESGINYTLIRNWDIQFNKAA